MSNLEFIAAMAKALAWPLAAFGIALLFRSKIVALLSPAMRRLKIGPIEAEWDRTMATTQVELDQARVATPQIEGPTRERPSWVQSAIDLSRSLLESGHNKAAVVEAFGAIERSLHSLLEDAAVEVTQRDVGGAGLARLAAKAGLVSDETAGAVEGLAVLKNLSTSDSDEIEHEKAAKYLAMTEGLVYLIERPGS